MRYPIRGGCFLCIGVLALSLLLPAQWAVAQNAKEEEALFVAKKAFEDGFYEVSIGLLERFLRNYPDSPRQAEVELLIARSYLQQNKNVEALNKLDALLGQEYARNIRDACLYWLAEVYFKGNSFNKAATYYRRVIQEFPHSAYIAASYYSLGWCLSQEGKFDEAMQYFKTVEEKYPKEPQAEDAAFKIIECLYNTKDYARLKEKAKSYLRTYQQENPRLSYLYFYQAEADYYLNNYADALGEYAKALASTDVKLKALCQLGTGWSLLKLKRYDEALASFSGVKYDDLEKRSQDILLLGKASLFLETNKINEARDTYDKLLGQTSDPSTLFEAYFGKASALYNLASYDEAIKTYKDALSKQWPENISAELGDKLHYNLAWAYLKKGEFKDGIREFQKVAKTTDDKIIKVSALCQVGDAYQDQGNYAKAQETYTSILKEYPDSSYSDYIQYQLGVAMLKSSNYDGAITIFLSLKNNFPGSKLLDDASYSLGLAYFQKQEYASSKEVFARFDDEFRDSYLRPQAAYLLGASLFNMGSFNDAISVFEGVIKKFAQDQELVQKCEYEIADCFYQMGNEGEALKRFSVLRTKYPNSSLTTEVIWWLGEYYYRHNDLDLSKRYFNSLINDFPPGPLTADAFYVLGSIETEEGRFDDAVGHFKKVIESSSADAAGKAAIAIADIDVKQNRSEAALESYQQVLKEYPNLASLVYPKMADIYFKAGNYKDALSCYRKSLDLVPVKEMAYVQFKIAESLQAQNALGEAIEEYLKVAYLHGQDNSLIVKALLRVAQLYESRDDFREALAVYKKIQEMHIAESGFAQERIDWINKNARLK